MRRQHITPRRSVATLSITTHNPLPSGIAGSLYSLTFTASGGQGNYRWRLLADYQSTGLTINALTGSLSGIPAVTGTGLILIAVTDSGGASVQQQFAVTFSAAPILTITTTSIPNATVGTAYSATVNAIAGATPYTWSISSDTPDTGSWLSINSSTGVFSGTPTTAETESLVVKVTDSVSHTASQPLSLSVTSVTAPAQTVLATLAALPSTNMYLGQTLDWYTTGAAQFSNVLTGTGPSWEVGTTGQIPAVVNSQAFAALNPTYSANSGWNTPDLPSHEAWLATGRGLTIAIGPDNPAGPGGDGGADVTHNPNPTSGGVPTAASVLTNGSTYNTNFKNWINTFCTNVLRPLTAKGWVLGFPMGEMNISNQWWNTDDPFTQGYPTFFTAAQWGQLYQIFWNQVVNVNGITKVGIGMEVGIEYSQGAGRIAALYAAAGANKVDYIGSDCNAYFPPTSTGSGGTALADRVRTYNAMVATGKIVMLASVGLDFGSSVGDNYTDIAADAIANQPNSKIIVYWSQQPLGYSGNTNTAKCVASPFICASALPSGMQTWPIGGNAGG